MLAAALTLDTLLMHYIGYALLSGVFILRACTTIAIGLWYTYC